MLVLYLARVLFRQHVSKHLFIIIIIIIIIIYCYIAQWWTDTSSLGEGRGRVR